MRKRERENLCGICGHYHKYEEGEPCGVCGHRPPVLAASPKHYSAFPSEILKDVLFLGSYDNASRSELLKTVGISHILNLICSPCLSFFAVYAKQEGSIALENLPFIFQDFTEISTPSLSM